MTMEEKRVFEEYNRNEIPSRWIRMKWIKDTERKYGLEQNRRVPYHSLQLYWNATLSYVYGNYLASVPVIGSALEAYFGHTFSTATYGKNPTLTKWIKIAISEEIISPTLGNELLNFSRNIRNNIVHPKGILGFSMLGMKARYKTKDSISWESPTGKPISLFTAKEASELGIELYLQTMKDILC